MQKLIKPDIVIFAYNRPKHLARTLNSLKKNLSCSKYNAFIFCDGPKNHLDFKKTLKVKKICESINFFKKKKIFYNKKNYGLYHSIIKGLSLVFNKFNSASVVVIEDDLNFGNYFLTYMTEALNAYSGSDFIGSISAYNFLKKNVDQDIYLSLRHSSWGWGTWKYVWNKINWNKKWIRSKFKSRESMRLLSRGGYDLEDFLHKQITNRINSWSVIFDLNCSLRNLHAVCPKFSIVSNHGLDRTGQHCLVEGDLNINFNNNYKPKLIKNIKPDKKIYDFFKKDFNISLKRKIYLYLQKKLILI